MTLRIMALAIAVIVASTSAWAAGDYPLDQFERIAQCMSDPSCTVEREDRIAGNVGDAEDLTKAYPICLGGCIMVCTTDACWCEIDDKC